MLRLVDCVDVHREYDAMSPVELAHTLSASGTRAWRVVTGEGDRSLLQPIGIDARGLGSMGDVRA